ncbi:MAG: GNAT family N-acetyltransferase [Chloroflexia bacterium]|nr:GNAT family N-acetyltransferase [Chloroflexia bacterium]
MTEATITGEKTESPTPGTGHEGQTFLVGDEIYLRGIDVADAICAMSWRHSLYPYSVDLNKEWIKDDLAKDDDLWFVIVRKSDDRVVGSVQVEEDGVFFWISAETDRLFGEAALRWKGEAIALVATWIIDERGQTTAYTEIPADETPVIEKLEAAGMRRTVRFRELLERDGQRVDRLGYEYLNRAWMAVLGDPRERRLERTGTGEARPVPPPVTLEGDPPRNAMMVGKRVYLRPEEPDDSIKSALAARQETETFFDIGRHLNSPVMLDKWVSDHEKAELPSWITFTVCLRENDEPIGWVALLDVDYQNRFAETGSFFGSVEHRGSGYGSEAKQLLLEYAFERLGLHMVQSWVYFPNTRSAAALRKQGYSESGRVNWLYSHNGTLGNFVAFDLLAEEWRAMPRQDWTPA